MNPTRNGKIARLSKYIRFHLNRRLEDGEPAKQLVEWLNGEPEVQKVLAEQFGGRPVSEQNLSEWKKGGYLEWLQHQESCDLVERLGEQAEDLEDPDGGTPVSDRFATLLAVEVVRVSEALLKERADPRERWQRLRELLQELGQLRRRDHQAARLRMDQQRWERERERLDEERHERIAQEMKRYACAPLWASLKVGAMAEVFGGGKTGRKIAEVIIETEEGLPPGTLSGEPPAATAPSNSVNPDQTESK